MESAMLNTQQKPLQRPYPNENLNGPRVSFNKDVHVKRIGGRSNENNNSYGLNGDDHLEPQLHTPQYSRELPQDLSREELIKEAEKVIAQTGRIKCTVDTPSSLAGIRIQEKLLDDRKFNSLPHRKKKSKPLDRSVSDASQKKSKRPSIFNIFSKRSDPNLSTPSNGTATESPRSGKRSYKPVGRSKSDVGKTSHSIEKGSQGKRQPVECKRIKIPECDESMTKAKKKTQLSPISENPPSEKLFGFCPEDRKLLHYTKGEEKQLGLDSLSDEENRSIKQSNSTIGAKHSRSLESLHSSQLPQEKLPLTKGMKVDGMVKRLSMDRFSPPLHFTSPAFSYTRPTESIVYAQVRRDEHGDKSKPTSDFPSTIHKSTNIREKSPTQNMFTANILNNSGRNASPTRQTLSTRFLNEKNRANQGNYQNSPIYFNGDREPVEYIHRIHTIDDDVGLDDRKHFIDDHSTSRNVSRQSSYEPPIIPTLRPSYGSIEHLANRRKLLESKIQERSFDFGQDTSKPNLHSNSQQRNKEPQVNGKRPLDEHFRERQNITSSPRKQWGTQPKYYPETNLNDEFLSDMDSMRREHERQRHKSYLDRKLHEITPANNNHIIDLGYIDQYDDNLNNINNNNNNNNNNINGKIIHLNYKNRTKGRAPQPGKPSNGTAYHIVTNVEGERRNMDKTDSSTQNDFKRHRDIHTDVGSRSYLPEKMKDITELFLKRECQFSESIHPSKKRYEYVFRERSIDDGSHFDPRLDKYPEHPKNHGTLRSKHKSDDKKSDKKFDSLKKQMKELFSKKKSPPPSNNSRISKDNDVEIIDLRPSQTTPQIDIAMRRRLSTPKASPVPKRIPSQKSSKISHVSSYRSSDVSTKSPPKNSWFKSLERFSRKPKDPKKAPLTVKRSNTTISRPSYQRTQSPSPDFKPSNQQHLRFFGDTDQESISKAATTSRKRTPLSANNSQSMQNLRGRTPTRNLTPDNSQSVRGATSMQNLHKEVRSRYLPDLSESTSENENVNIEHKTHPITIHHSTPNAKYHKSRRPYHSMEYLENDKPNDVIRSENNSQRSSRLGSREIDWKNSLNNEKNAEILHQSALRERNGRSNSETRYLPPKGPTKPAREIDRRRALSNERFLESSGTEGESSQQSVVYLHATTVGHIPQPYVASSRQSTKSRDELSSIKSKSSPSMQPMTRTVSRSVSMLAPWTPRHISEGYEINYSQTMQNPKKKNGSKMRDMRGTQVQSRSKDDISSLSKSSTLPKHRK